MSTGKGNLFNNRIPLAEAEIESAGLKNGK